MAITHVGLRRMSVAVAAALFTAVVPAAAQTAPGGDARGVSVRTGVDVVNRYVFRGIRQNATKVAVRPFADVDVGIYTSDAALERLSIGAGFLNSLHTGDTGSAGPSGRLWYESDVYAALRLRFDGGLSVTSAFTSYMSPNDMFDTVKELSLAIGFDDRPALGRAALRPYVLAAMELDAAMGAGQADGGHRAGSYLELGMAPGYEARRLTVAFPVKVGLSLADYYELGGDDHRFGFASVGATATVPLLSSTRFGRWSVQGGIEHQRLGEATQTFNGGDGSSTIGSFGVRLSY